MHSSPHKLYFTIIFFSFYYYSFSQCSIQTGAPPNAYFFNTGQGSQGNPDAKWQIAVDSINAVYNPAVIMKDLSGIYFNPVKWIAFSASGEHNGDRFFFYKFNFDLPCYNLCGTSYNDDNAFCLNLDLYADNSIYEIYVNGVVQSQNLGGVIPLPNPFNPINHTQSDKTAVSLCRNWKAGNNTLIIQVASSATVEGLMAEASINPPPPPDADTVSAKICAGEIYKFGNLDISQTGYYFQSFHRSSGCDSNVVLNLNVLPVPDTIIDKSICEGEIYEGHVNSGTYTNTFAGANGCDSISTLKLTVQKKPTPDLGNKTTVCDGDSLILNPGLFSSYAWQDGSVNDHYVVKKPGLYFVTVTNACGVAKDEINITTGICHVYFPTAFTPNNDGLNDHFKILTDYQLEEYHLEIYNRWGQKVFETKNISEGWDGNLKSKQQPGQSTFAWFCTYKRQGIITTLRGTVVLIK